MSKGGSKYADADGQFRRTETSFRNFISADPNAEFPAEKDRYVLYLGYGCPWAHRTNIVRSLKGLEDIIQLVIMDPSMGPEGWFFSGRFGTAEKDPLYGFTKAREFYFKADPDYSSRFTVPFVWDKVKATIVNNESSEIIRMFYTAFDSLIPKEMREETKGDAGLFPEKLRPEIEKMNDWVYNLINNGVYKTGFASSQEAYEEHIYPLFKSLDRVEEHLGQPGHSPYLFGEHITEADVRLYTTLIRFDVAYHTLFKCNLKMIRHDYPRVDKWLRKLYWGTEAFKETTKFDQIKLGYAGIGKGKIVPAGPSPDILPL
ncbi:hypothetical protein LTR66_010978 [Elasticomyces elasticus]|nr:hypothetical protein LTR66_010978 [Elasticomyces elasticus]